MCDEEEFFLITMTKSFLFTDHTRAWPDVSKTKDKTNSNNNTSYIRDWSGIAVLSLKLHEHFMKTRV